MFDGIAQYNYLKHSLYTTKTGPDSAVFVSLTVSISVPSMTFSNYGKLSDLYKYPTFSQILVLKLRGSDK